MVAGDALHNGPQAVGLIAVGVVELINAINPK